MKQRFLNILLVNLLIFFSLISIHEIGHVIAGGFLGCQLGKAILIDGNFIGPYAEIACQNQINQTLLFLSSFIITASFGILFLFLNSPQRNMFFVVFGLSLIFSSLDFLIVTGLQSIMYALIGSGFIFMCIGEYFLASFYIKEVPEESLLY